MKLLILPVLIALTSALGEHVAGVDAKNAALHDEERLLHTLSFEEAFVSVAARARAVRPRGPDEMRRLQASCKENVARVDLDHDERLSLEEFQQLLMIMSNRHGF